MMLRQFPTGSKDAIRSLLSDMRFVPVVVLAKVVVEHPVGPSGHSIFLFFLFLLPEVVEVY